MSAPAIDDTATCEAVRCGSRAAAIATTGCVHEHIHTGPICQAHIDWLAHDDLYCAHCRKCTDPHRCVVTVIKLEVLP